MKFESTEIDGVVLITPERIHDERGFFARAFCEREFEARGLPTRFPQCNLSHNYKAATLRGIPARPLGPNLGRRKRCPS